MDILQIVIGGIMLILLGAIFSRDSRKINPLYLFNAIALQFVLSFLLIKVPPITNAFNSLSKGVLALKEATDTVSYTHLTLPTIAIV